MPIRVPIKVLHKAEGHIVTLETITGEVYRGKLIEAEDNMNLSRRKNCKLGKCLYSRIENTILHTAGYVAKCADVQETDWERWNTSPLWDDFIVKTSKLHACLRAVIQAIGSYLDAFQKIADAATNSRGASKEIGTALTRVCLRHKAVETRMKTFTSVMMDCLIVPLQDKLEDWKKQVTLIDKEHAKEYKRCHTELKKRSNDTLRLQKKARKDQSDAIQSLVDSHMQGVTLRRAELEEMEKKSLRAAMIEERMRYCSFVGMLQPVVKEEFEVMSELGHLQEAMESIAIVTKDPHILPQTSEESILESKSAVDLYPESPGGGSSSLGSRKSSVCSTSSMNSNSSSSYATHCHNRSTSQYSTSTSQSHAVSTWPPHLQDAAQTSDLPHTISSVYEKGHHRPALTVYTFQKPATIVDSQKSPSMSCRPQLPVRCSSLERPLSATGVPNLNINLTQRQCPSPIPAYITKESFPSQPEYANTSELSSMAVLKTKTPSTRQIFSGQLNLPCQPTASSASSFTNFNQLHSYSVPSSGTKPTHLSVNLKSIVSAVSPPEVEESIKSSKISHSSDKKLQSDAVLGEFNNTEAKTNVSLERELQITETEMICNQPQSSLCGNKDILSPESDDISRASVQQKASLFEKLERDQNTNNHLSNITSARSTHIFESIDLSKREELYKNTGLNARNSGYATAMAKRSSNNSLKPAPPVRRSSSVTPNHNYQLNSPQILQDSPTNLSTETMPLPPVNLLDRARNNSPTVNVAETVKALTVIRHTPASPTILRRAQQHQVRKSSLQVQDFILSDI